jgi:hypothetical protein
MAKIDADKVVKAVDWWADRIVNVGPSSFDNDDPANGGMVMMLGLMAAQGRQPTEAQVLSFRMALSRELNQEIANEDSDRIVLSCDYHPEGYLWLAAQEAEISELVFPIKTHMWITSDAVKVACGYGADAVTLD